MLPDMLERVEQISYYANVTHKITTMRCRMRGERKTYSMEIK
eukprot:UN06068